MLLKRQKRRQAPDPERNRGFAGGRRGTLYVLEENSQVNSAKWGKKESFKSSW